MGGAKIKPSHDSSERKDTLPIGGILTEVETKTIDIDKMYLDEENPRIGFYKASYDPVKSHLTQEEIAFAVENKNPEAFEKLKQAIEINEGVIYPIWVKPLTDDNYLVIEGNTRLIIYRKLRDKYPFKETYKKIPCRVLPKEIRGEQIDFIKLEAHLRGTTPWDAYEKARYLFKLYDKEGYSISRLEKLTRMSQNEIKASIEAFKDMEEQYLPRYGAPNEVFKFSYFVEYEKDRKLKEIMTENNFTLSNFCEWVGTEKIPKAQDVRDLRHILELEESRKIFVRDGYEYALQKLGVIKPDLVSPLFRNIERVIEDLKNLPSYEISEMIEGEQPQKKQLIIQLYHQVKRFVESHFGEDL